MIKLLPLINETIYGENAIVYHRTSTKDLINGVYTTGFKPGGGDTYGNGFYATYDLNSQLNDTMRYNYGNIIVKFSCPTTNFVFFEWDEFKKTELCRKLKCTEDDFIFKQLDHFDISYDMKQLSKEIEYEGKKGYSSSIANIIRLTDKSFIHKVRGMVFYGRHDGKVLLSYDVKRIVPLSYTIDEGQTWTKVPTNRSYLKQSIMQKLSVPTKLQQAVETILDRMDRSKVRSYSINSKGLLDIEGDVDLYGTSLTRLPVKFGNVSGDFMVSTSKLQTMYGFPDYVGKNFSAYKCKFTDLTGSPKETGGDYDIHGNDIRSLKGGPEKVGELFDCSGCQLTSFIGGPKEAEYVDVRNNAVKFQKSDITSICDVAENRIIL